jgi:hypothetical protein
MMNHFLAWGLRRVFISAMAVLTMVLACKQAALTQTASKEAKAQIDLVLIVDTSQTMVGKAGGRNVFPEVKRVLKEMIDACDAGDNVVLISYDATVREYPAALIYGQQDKEAMYRQIDDLKAEGDWTYTAAAIQKGLEEAKRLDDAQTANKHTKVVILLTDGLNNPPRQVRGTAAEVHLSDVARRVQGMPWFVWQIQLGPQIDAEVDQAFRDAGFQNYQPVKTAREQLAQVRADILKQIEAEKSRRAAEDAAARGRQKASEDLARLAAKDVARRQAEELAKQQQEVAQRRTAEQTTKPARRWPWIVGGLVALLSTALLLYKLRPAPKLKGELYYWKPPEKAMPVDLGSLGRRSIRIGDGTDCELSLPGLGKRALVLLMRRVGHDEVCVAEAGENETLAFNGATPHTLELYDSDEFQFGSYHFRYRGDIGPRPKEE